MASKDGLRVLLLGAGFTRNWGGWLASEMVGELCGRLADRPHINEMLRVTNNFEETYGTRRLQAEREPDNVQAAKDVESLQLAIFDVFREMNLWLAERSDFNFSTEARCSTRRFLSRFDAIFTLNQDLLFELHYDGMFLESDGRWDGHYYPGLTMTPEFQTASFKKDRIDMTLTLADTISVREQRLQPIYKLHGSVNWRMSHGDRVLVIGTGKEDMIADSGILRSYHEIFREYLFRGNTQIMVLGYGFSDRHVNDVLCDAARDHRMLMYVVNPAGLRCFDADLGISGNGRNRLLQIPLAGFCTRDLREVLSGSGNPAFKSFDRFLARS